MVAAVQVSCATAGARVRSTPRTRTLALFAVLASLSACGPARDQARLDEAARTLFSQLDRADYKAVYDEASGAFQKGPGGVGGFTDAMNQNRRKLGRCKAPTKRGSLRTIPTLHGLVSVQDYAEVCASGVANVEVSTVSRQGRPGLIGLHFTSPAFETLDPLNTRPEWISDADLALLRRLDIDPQAGLETRGAYHWRWRASHGLKAGTFACPPGSTVDISRTIKVIVAADGLTCRNTDGGDASMLKLDADGSAAPLSDAH